MVCKNDIDLKFDEPEVEALFKAFKTKDGKIYSTVGHYLFFGSHTDPKDEEPTCQFDCSLPNLCTDDNTE